MRILHFADLHLGVESYGRIDPTTGLSSRLGDFLAALDEVVDYALHNEIDLVLFCGDAYKTRDPSQTYQREFAKRIRRLSGNGIQVFLLAGNHDLPVAPARATSVEIFDTLAIENVTVANRAQTVRIQTRGGQLQIVALPWVRRGALTSREDVKNLTPAQINEKIEGILTGWLEAEAQSLDPGIPAVLAGHFAHSGAMPGSERTMLMGRDYVLLQSTLANPAFEYVALGHMHSHQKAEGPVPIVYPGSLQSIDFGDEGKEKGFYVVEIDGAAPRGNRLGSYQFHGVKARRFLTIKVNADVDDPTAAVLAALGKKDVTDAVLRVQVSLSAATEPLFREAEVRKALRDAYCVAAVSREVEREHRSRLGAQSVEGMTPLEALKLYLESRKTSPERFRQLIEYGERLIHQSSAPE